MGDIMRVDRKEEICGIAIQLFNEKGYGRVTMREIAKKAGTTIGNLTYYFKKKEDIVIHFISHIHGDYCIYFSSNLHDLDLLRDIVFSFQRAKVNEEKYPFYFKDLNVLIKDSQYFTNITQNFQKNLYDYYLSCFTVLQKDKILKQCFSLDDFHILAISFTALISGWLLDCLPYHNPLLKNMSISQNLATLFKPYIADNYIADYHKILRDCLQ